MSSDCEATTAPDAESTASDWGASQEMSERFKQLTAQRAVEAAITDDAIACYVGLRLALLTPPSGRVEATLDELATRWRLNKGTVTKALRALVAAGLLRSRRRGSVANVYTWTDAAQAPRRRSLLSGAAGALGEGGDDAAQVAERMRAAHRVLLGCYVDERARAYGLDAALGYADEHRVQWRPLCVAVLRWVEVYQAEGEQWADALERVCRAAVRAWLSRPGRDRWLIEHRHPLERMATDLDWVAGEMKLKRHKAAAPKTEASGERPCEYCNVAGRHTKDCRRKLYQQREAA